MNKLITINFLLVMAIAINAQQTDFPKLTGPYLAQKHPGDNPKIFAPGIVSTDFFNHSTGWVRVEIKDCKPKFKQYNYLEGANLLNSNHWAKLISPEKLKPKE